MKTVTPDAILHYNDCQETTHQDILNLLHDAAVVCDYIIKS